MLLRRHQACRLCMSKVLRSMPAVSVDLPSLYCYSAAFGQCWWGLQRLAGAQRAAEFHVQTPGGGLLRAGVGYCGHRARKLLHGERGTALLRQRECNL